VVIGLVVGGGGGLLASWVIDYVNQLNDRIATLEVTGERAADEAREQTARADRAERSSREATAARQQAEAEAETAQEQAAAADQRAAMALDRAADAQATSLAAQAEARRVQEEAEATRQAAEAEMNRLSEALGRIAETRRTALGLMMSLDEAYLKFDFDRADLRQESREILSRIAGILFTSEDFAITISGHTDARGNDQYNQRLSERRAQAVADYLIEAGLARERFTVQGLGKAYPVDTGNSDEAHARNRRVELGIVNARIVDSPQIEP
jgi:outer membrane protein OmpA-like peptidoglycan-associated protein